MAVGSNTLGLLFKIGVDAGDVQKTFSGIGDSFKQGFSEGIAKGAKDAEKAVNDTGNSLKALLTPLNQARRGFDDVFHGDALEGTLSLTRALGPLGIAIAGVAVAAAGLGFAIKGAIDAAQEIGTTSKDDFEELQKKVESAGQSITELQRAMAQGVTAAVDQVSGAVTAFFAKILEKNGPAIIALLREVATFITGTLIPLIDKYGDRITDMIARTIALWRTLNHEFSASDFLKGLPTLDEVFAKNLADVRAEIENIGKTLPPATALIADHTKVIKDLTEAQLEQNRAARDLALAREKAAQEQAQIDREFEAGAITVEEALNRRLAIQQTLTIFEEDLLDKEKTRIEEDVKGENRRKDALEAVANAREILAAKDAATQDALKDKAAEAAEQIRKFYERLGQEIHDFWFKQSLEINKAIDKAVEVQPEGGGVGQTIIDNIHAQAEALDPLTKAWREVKFAFGEFVDSMTEGITPLGLLTDALGSMSKALEQTFANFILTGKLGAEAIKSLTATILAQLAVEAFFMVLKENAKAAADTAEAATDLAFGDYTGFVLHSIAAAAHHKAAITWALIGGGAAAAGLGLGLSGGLAGGKSGATANGQFGGDLQPSPITINQGAAVQSLAISIDELNKKITGMNPGDVLARGAEQNPTVVGQANNEAARRDGTISRQFLEIAGLRPA